MQNQALRSQFFQKLTIFKLHFYLNYFKIIYLNVNFCLILILKYVSTHKFP